jgi:hypothetical protein
MCASKFLAKITERKSPLEGTSGDGTVIMWLIDPFLRGVSVNNSLCYGAPTAYACAVTSQNNRRGDARGVFSRSAPRLYDDRPCSVERVELS